MWNFNLCSPSNRGRNVVFVTPKLCTSHLALYYSSSTVGCHFKSECTLLASSLMWFELPWLPYWYTGKAGQSRSWLIRHGLEMNSMCTMNLLHNWLLTGVLALKLCNLLLQSRYTGAAGTSPTVMQSVRRVEFLIPKGKTGAVMGQGKPFWA